MLTQFRTANLCVTVQINKTQSCFETLHNGILDHCSSAGIAWVKAADAVGGPVTITAPSDISPMNVFWHLMPYKPSRSDPSSKFCLSSYGGKKLNLAKHYVLSELSRIALPRMDPRGPDVHSIVIGTSSLLDVCLHTNNILLPGFKYGNLAGPISWVKTPEERVTPAHYYYAHPCFPRRVFAPFRSDDQAKYGCLPTCPPPASLDDSDDEELPDTRQILREVSGLFYLHLGFY